MTRSAPNRNKLDYITAGKSAIIYGIDSKRILKEYFEDDRRDVEFQAYHRLGSHPNIARYFGFRGANSIILERGKPVHTIYQERIADQIPVHTKIRWIRQAARGLYYIHQKGIIHADVGVNNMIIVNDCLKIIDFEGCSINGKPADSCYQWYCYRPSPTVNIQTDIFAYGCAIYEIMTGKPPYHEFEGYPDRYVEQLYAANQFPDVSRLPLGELMLRCWNGTFQSMADVIQDLEAFRPSAFRWNCREVTWAVVSLHLVLVLIIIFTSLLHWNGTTKHY